MTVSEFVKSCGSQGAAAKHLWVCRATVNRWLRGHKKPHKQALMRFAQLGIEWTGKP